MAGILEPTEGTIEFDGLNYKDNEIAIKQNIAYLSGNTKLYHTLTPYELLKMCCEIYNVPKEKAEIRIKEISKILNLETFLSNKIANLSTGQTQRGKTILYSTHYMEEAQNICDRVIMMNKGTMIKTGTPEEIQKETKTTNLREAFFKMIGGVSHEE